MGNEREPSPATVPHAATQKTERMVPMKPIAIPEQVVGSRHSFFATPTLFGPAKVSVLVNGTQDFDLTTKIYELSPLEPARDFEIIYHPYSRGTHRTEVSLLAVWDDGHSEKQTVPVTADSRMKTDPPKDAVTASSNDSLSAVDVSAEGARKDVSDSPLKKSDYVTANLKTENVGNSLDRLFGLRMDGVEEASRQASPKVEDQPEGSIWWDIAADAISFGTGGLGGILAQAIEHKLEKIVSARAGKFVASFTENALNNVVNDSAKFIAAQVGKKPATTRTMTEFFLVQKAALRASNEKMANEVAAGMAKAESEVSLDEAGIGTVATHLVESIHTLTDGAQRLQTHASVKQWIEYQAQQSMGSVVSSSTGKKTTFLGDARHDREWGDLNEGPRSFSGLLDLYVTSAEEVTRVTRATIGGISHEIADNLNTEDLGRMGIPIRFHVPIGPSPRETRSVSITRDESGRVRFQEDQTMPVQLEPENGAFDLEAQSLRKAEMIVNTSLSKTLAAWGVKVEVTS